MQRDTGKGHRDGTQGVPSKQSASFCLNHGEGSSGRSILESGAGFYRES